MEKAIRDAERRGRQQLGLAQSAVLHGVGLGAAFTLACDLAHREQALPLLALGAGGAALTHVAGRIGLDLLGDATGLGNAIRGVAAAAADPYGTAKYLENRLPLIGGFLTATNKDQHGWKL